MRRALVLLALLSLSLGSVRLLSLADLCKGSTRIVVGGVTKMTSHWEGSLIVTDVTIVPNENLKGSGAAPFTVRIPGGTIGDVTLKAGEAPVFAVGEMVVLFLKTGSGSPCDVYGWFRGKYTVVGGQIRELKNTSLAQYRASILEELRK